MAHRLQDDINGILPWLDHQHDDHPVAAQPEEEGKFRESDAEPAISRSRIGVVAGEPQAPYGLSRIKSVVAGEFVASGRGFDETRQRWLPD